MKAILVCALLAGCGGKSEDWSKRPLETKAAKADDINFTIDVPKGMRQKDDAGGVVWDFLIDGRVYTPDISVRAGGYAKTLDEYLATEKSVENWVRKETLPDGYVASYENPSYKGREDYIVYVYKKFGDKVLTCNARVTPWEKGGKTKDKLPQLEKICSSMAVK
jgi:hypothetical protein